MGFLNKAFNFIEIKSIILKSDFLKFFGINIKWGNVKFNQKIIPFAIFFLISTILWFLIRLNDVFVSDISYPVKYTNFYKEKLLASELPSKITLKVEADGYTLLKYKMKSTIQPITIDVKNFSFPLNQNGLVSRYFIQTEFSKLEIEKQLSQEMKLIDIKPDSLYFDITDLMHKKVPVKANISFDLDRQFMLSDSIFTIPDSLTISGAANIIDTVDYVMTKQIELNKLNTTTRKNVAVQTIKNIDFNRSRVLVVIPVEQFTEGIIKLPVEIRNLPDTATLKLFPKEVQVKYLIGLSNFDKAKQESFKVAVNYRDIDSLIGNKLKVQLINSPSYISQPTISPSNVEFIIERK